MLGFHVFCHCFQSDSFHVRGDICLALSLHTLALPSLPHTHLPLAKEFPAFGPYHTLVNFVNKEITMSIAQTKTPPKKKQKGIGKSWPKLIHN